MKSKQSNCFSSGQLVFTTFVAPNFDDSESSLSEDWFSHLMRVYQHERKLPAFEYDEKSSIRTGKLYSIQAGMCVVYLQQVSDTTSTILLPSGSVRVIATGNLTSLKEAVVRY